MIIIKIMRIIIALMMMMMMMMTRAKSWWRLGEPACICHVANQFNQDYKGHPITLIILIIVMIIISMTMMMEIIFSIKRRDLPNNVLMLPISCIRLIGWLASVLLKSAS